jgi:hypothetical protein
VSPEALRRRIDDLTVRIAQARMKVEIASTLQDANFPLVQGQTRIDGANVWFKAGNELARDSRRPPRPAKELPDNSVPHMLTDRPCEFGFMGSPFPIAKTPLKAS